MALHRLHIALLLTTLLGSLGCGPRNVQQRALPPSTARVGILLPVFCNQPGNPTLCHKNFFAKPVSSENLHDFYQSLYFEFESSQVVHLISQKTIEDIFYREKNLGVGDDIATLQTWWPKILQEAQEQNMTFLVIPLLYHYQERQGSAAGIEKAASIAFELVTFRVTDGQEVGRQFFEETQQSLSEDPLEISKIFKRRGRWVSARDLTREAGRQMIADLEKTFRN